MATAKIRTWTLIVVAASLVYSSPVNAQSSRNTRSKRTIAQPQTPVRGDTEFEQFVKLADEARLAERLDEARRRLAGGGCQGLGLQHEFFTFGGKKMASSKGIGAEAVRLVT